MAKTAEENQSASMREQLAETFAEELHLGKVPVFLDTLRAIFLDRERLSTAMDSERWEKLHVMSPIAYLTLTTSIFFFCASVFAPEPEKHGIWMKIYEVAFPALCVLFFSLPNAIFVHLLLGKRRKTLNGQIYVSCYYFGTLLLICAIFSPWLGDAQGKDAPPALAIFLFIAVVWLGIAAIRVEMFHYSVGFWRLSLTNWLASIPAAVLTFVLLGGVGAAISATGLIDNEAKATTNAASVSEENNPAERATGTEEGR